MLNNAQYESLIEDSELAFFRAGVCLGSPQSYTLEEKTKICEDMEDTNVAIEKAMRDDFGQMPPAAQGKMLDLLQKADPDHFGWWKKLLGVSRA